MLNNFEKIKSIFYKHCNDAEILHIFDKIYGEYLNDKYMFWTDTHELNIILSKWTKLLNDFPIVESYCENFENNVIKLLSICFIPKYDEYLMGAIAKFLHEKFKNNNNLMIKLNNYILEKVNTNELNCFIDILQNVITQTSNVSINKQRTFNLLINEILRFKKTLFVFNNDMKHANEKEYDIQDLENYQYRNYLIDFEENLKNDDASFYVCLNKIKNEIIKDISIKKFLLDIFNPYYQWITYFILINDEIKEKISSYFK